VDVATAFGIRVDGRTRLITTAGVTRQVCATPLKSIPTHCAEITWSSSSSLSRRGSLSRSRRTPSANCTSPQFRYCKNSFLGCQSFERLIAPLVLHLQLQPTVALTFCSVFCDENTNNAGIKIVDMRTTWSHVALYKRV